MPGCSIPMPRHAAPPASSRTGESDLLVNVEREHIQRALERANGNKKAAARMLGLSRRALYRRLERLDLGDHHHATTRDATGNGARLRRTMVMLRRASAAVCNRRDVDGSILVVDDDINVRELVGDGSRPTATES